MFQQGREDPACRPPGAENQQSLAGNGDAKILGQIAEQSDAVGIIAVDRIVLLQRQGVYGLGEVGTIAQRVGQLEGQFLQGDGAIESSATLAEEIPDRWCKSARLDILGGIGQQLSSLFGEQAMDARRLAVTDGMAKNGVAVGCAHGARVV